VTLSGIFTFRLDFDKVIVNDPLATVTPGLCSTDKILAASPGSFTLPTLCGTLTGTHSNLKSK